MFSDSSLSKWSQYKRDTFFPNYFTPLLTNNIKSTWLTFDFHAHCAIVRDSNSIVSCTAVCSICTFLDITQEMFSIDNWKQRHTVCTVIFYFGPDYVWCWFTSCIATQSHQRAFTNYLIVFHISNSRGHCNNYFASVTGLQCPWVSKGCLHDKVRTGVILQRRMHGYLISYSVKMFTCFPPWPIAIFDWRKSSIMQNDAYFFMSILQCKNSVVKGSVQGRIDWRRISEYTLKENTFRSTL